jgi:predicted enzyme related to lactoylglutathione lyase
MASAPDNPVVHLELHTGNLPRACAFYTGLFGWSTEAIDAGCRAYLALGLGKRIEGGAVECGIERPLWLPYVEVDDIADLTRHARSMGASVLLEPREGPAGWRSVIVPESGAEVALWQPKK